MGIATEALKEPAHLLVNHGVMGHAIDEVGFLRRGRQLAVKQEIAGLEKVAVFGQIGNRIAAIEQDALVAIDIGDFGLAASRGREAGIVGENAGFGVELAHIQHFRADRAVVNRERIVLVAERNGAGLDIGAGLCVHGFTSSMSDCPTDRSPAGPAYSRKPLSPKLSRCALQDNSQ